jgi:hypothetical protein
VFCRHGEEVSLHVLQDFAISAHRLILALSSDAPPTNKYLPHWRNRGHRHL